MGGREIDEAQMRFHYTLLRHEGYYTTVHCQNVESGAIVGRETVYGVEAVAAFARKYNGLGNLFVGRNPRRDSTGKTLGALSSFSFDVDPDREKGTAATAEQRQAALGVSRRILAALPGGSLLDSGNGYQIFYTWKPREGGEESYELFAKKAARWSKQFDRFALDSGCAIDRVHDNARLVKLAGTLSVKGAEDQWRMASFGAPLPLVRDCRFVFDRISAVSLDAPATAPSIGDSRSFEDEVVVAARALSRLSPDRGHNYNDWIRVGMSLRHLGDAGLALWDAWSKRRRGYEDGACAAKWATFDATPTGEGVTVGSLVKWANDDARLGDVRCGPESQPPVESLSLVTPATYMRGRAARRAGAGDDIEIRTGLAELDAFGPLLVRGHIFTIGARTNNGKTTLALTLAVAAAKQQKRVIIFSTETSADETFDRLALALAGWGADEATIEAALASVNVTVGDGFQPNLEAVRRAFEEGKPDVFVFDHIQHIESVSEQRVQEVSRFTRGLHDLTRKHNVAAIIASQLNRAAEHEELALRHLKECGTIEEESRAVLLMKRLTPNLQATTFPVVCTLAKNKGKMGTCQLLLNTQSSRFESMGGAYAGTGTAA